MVPAESHKLDDVGSIPTLATGTDGTPTFKSMTPLSHLGYFREAEMKVIRKKRSFYGVCSLLVEYLTVDQEKKVRTLSDTQLYFTYTRKSIIKEIPVTTGICGDFLE